MGKGNIKISYFLNMDYMLKYKHFRCIEFNTILKLASVVLLFKMPLLGI